MSLQKKKIKDCNVGDKFTLANDETTNYINIIVPKSITLEYIDRGEKFAFNVIALEDGRPRTFHPDSEVWVFDHKEVTMGSFDENGDLI